MTASADVFTPARQRGFMVHAGAALCLLAGGGLSGWLAFQQEQGYTLILYLLLALALLIPLPGIVYRLHGLAYSSYTLTRDGLMLRWGLRGEDISLPDIEWISPLQSVPFVLPLPPLYNSGVLIGSYPVRDFGRVEYLATDVSQLLLISTGDVCYAISPDDTEAFMAAYENAVEEGSVAPLEAQSIRPTTILWGMWNDPVARILLLGGFTLALILLVVSSLVIPTREVIHLGYNARGLPLDPVPSERLLLLPVLGLLFFFFDLGVGSFYYSSPNRRTLAYLVWGGGAVTPLLLIAAVAFLL
jgi:hypothetical protein